MLYRSFLDIDLEIRRKQSKMVHGRREIRIPRSALCAVSSLAKDFSQQYNDTTSWSRVHRREGGERNQRYFCYCNALGRERIVSVP